MVINSQRFVASTGSKHDDPGPVCRGVVLIGCQLQQLNKAVDIIIIRCAVLVFDEYFELDANRLQAQQSRTLIRRVNTQRVTAFDALTTKRQELVFTFTTPLEKLNCRKQIKDGSSRQRRNGRKKKLRFKEVSICE